MKTAILGNAFAALSFLLWGAFPLYYQYLPNSDVNELLSLRIIFTIPFIVIVVFILNIKINLKAILTDSKSTILCFFSGLIMAVSWYAFTWAMTNNQVLSASLGYFISPIFSVMLAVCFLKEKLNKYQLVAILFCVFGVLFQVCTSGDIPFLALIMGSFFAIYGLIKKYVHFDVLTSLLLESILLSPICMLYLIYDYIYGVNISFSSGANTFLLYIGTAPITLAPLILFTFAIKKTSLTMIGIMQYIEPTLQFILAVFIFNEVFDSNKSISYIFIWIGICIYTFEPFISKYLNKRNIYLCERH